MIILWLRAAAIWLLKLLIPPPPPPPPIPQIDPCAPCPSCGHRKGRITSVEIDGKMLVQHDCDVCKARWHEKAVLQDPTAVHMHAQPQKV